MARGTIYIDEERCKGCGLCPAVCPQSVIAISKDRLNDKGYFPAMLVDPVGCTGCAVCAVICPDGCITVYREVRAKRQAAADV